MLTPVGRNRFPVLRRPAILMSRVPAVAGEGRTILHEEGQALLFGDFQVIVSSGMAGWGYPIRTGKHSEYVMIDLFGTE